MPLTISSTLRWLFIDLNSYFASVEQQLHPELRGRPVAVVPVLSDSTCALLRWPLKSPFDAGIDIGWREPAPGAAPC